MIYIENLSGFIFLLGLLGLWPPRYQSPEGRRFARVSAGRRDTCKAENL